MKIKEIFGFNRQKKPKPVLLLLVLLVLPNFLVSTPTTSLASQNPRSVSSVTSDPKELGKQGSYANSPSTFEKKVSRSFSDNPFNEYSKTDLSLYQQLVPGTERSLSTPHRFIIAFDSLAGLNSFYRSYYSYYIISSFRHLPFAVVDAPLSAYYQFSKLGSVRGVWLDTYRTFVNTSKISSIAVSGDVSSIGYYASHLLGADSLLSQGFNGSGVKIAILDTGIDSSHPDLDDFDNNPATNDPKVIAEASFIDYDFDGANDTSSYDWYFHGTHCAGIAAANGNIQGVAPGAYLLNGKVLDYSGAGYDSWILNGIDWAIANGADIISMSLGTGAHLVDSVLNVAIDAAWEQGVFVVVAAGNDGPDYVSIGSPGMASRAFTVGAYDSYGGIAEFSSAGPSITGVCDPDILAPGVNILSTASDRSYLIASGTSMATPTIAGVVALLKSAFPSASNDLIRAALLATASSISKDRFRQGAGLVNVSKAYEYLQNSYPFIFPSFDVEHVLRLSAGERFSYQLDAFLVEPSDTISFSISSNLQHFVSITPIDTATQGWVRAKVTLTMPNTEVNGVIYVSNSSSVICQTDLVLRLDSYDYQPNDVDSGTDAGETFDGAIEVALGERASGTLPIGDADIFSFNLLEGHYYSLTLSELTGFCIFEIFDANKGLITNSFLRDFSLYEPYYFKASISGTYYVRLVRNSLYLDKRATLSYKFQIQEAPQDIAEQGINPVTVDDAYNISTVDNNHDGKFDAIIFEFNINVRKIGVYTVFGFYYLDFGTYTEHMSMNMFGEYFGSETGVKSIIFTLDSDYISLLNQCRLTKISMGIFDELQFIPIASHDFELDFQIDPSEFAPSSDPLINSEVRYLDPDNDGFLDVISLDLTFDFAESGNYSIIGFLYQGETFAAYLYLSFTVEEPGEYTASLKLLKEHFQNQLSNFYIRGLSLSWEKHVLPLRISIPPEKLTVIESPLSLSITEETIDTDNNSLNDSLMLNVTAVSTIALPDLDLRFLYPLVLASDGYGALFDYEFANIVSNLTCQIIQYNISLVELATLNKTGPLLFPQFYLGLDPYTYAFRTYVTSNFSLGSFDTLPFIVLDNITLVGEDEDTFHIQMTVFSISTCSATISATWTSALTIFGTYYHITQFQLSLHLGLQTVELEIAKSTIIDSSFIGTISLYGITGYIETGTGYSFDLPHVRCSITSIDYRDYLKSNSNYFYDINFGYAKSSEEGSSNLSMALYLHSSTAKTVSLSVSLWTKLVTDNSLNKTSVQITSGMNIISFSFNATEIIRLGGERTTLWIDIDNFLDTTPLTIHCYIPIDAFAINYIKPITYLYTYSAKPLDYENDTILEGAKFTLPLIINKAGYYGFRAELSLTVSIERHAYIFDLEEKSIYSDVKYYAYGRAVVDFIAPISTFIKALELAEGFGLTFEHCYFYIENLAGIEASGQFKIDQYILFPTEEIDFSRHYVPSLMTSDLSMSYDDATETLSFTIAITKLTDSNAFYDAKLELICFADGEAHILKLALGQVEPTDEYITNSFTIASLLSESMFNLDTKDINSLSFFAVLKLFKADTSNIIDYAISQTVVSVPVYTEEQPTIPILNGGTILSPGLYFLIFASIFVFGTTIILLIIKKWRY